MNRTMLAAVVLAALAVGSPAAADDTYTQVGMNNGDGGFVSLAFGAGGTPPGAESPSGGAVNANCEFHQQNRPNSNETVLVVEGHAHATPKGTVRPVSVGLRCVLINYFTRQVAVDHAEATESVNALWLRPQVDVRTATSYVVCSSTNVHWSDDTFTFNSVLACQSPS